MIKNLVIIKARRSGFTGLPSFTEEEVIAKVRKAGQATSIEIIKKTIFNNTSENGKDK